ncbi:chemotaxis protein CheA [Novosphingobium sp. TW-4]|uniref:Chemotaxis protein CheA n=2 Tax=Novosphingobium olei TaxID=2728851 RepID=A0A7Y0BPH5_9SPHN|nr:chemotaxis protein CheA [Novosphingobium olei]
MPLRSSQPLSPAEEAARAAETADLAASFVEETRALLEEANSALLNLERHPEDAEAINALFRCVHSIKGAAGLFDLPALIHLVHAGEDLLGAMREGELSIDAELTDQLLAGLDRVARWNEMFRADGVLPAEAMEEARSFASIYRARLGRKNELAARSAGQTENEGAQLPEWARTSGEAISAVSDGSDDAVLVEYTPDEGCFFAGEDPLRVALATPGLIWLDIGIQAPWPAGEAFDPFACNLRFRIVSNANRAEVEHHFRYVPDNTALTVAATKSLAEPDEAFCENMRGGLDPLAVELLEAQQRALALPGRHGQVGDIETTLRNLCRSQNVPCPLHDGPADADALGRAIADLLLQMKPAGSDALTQTPASDIALERHEASGERTLRVEQGKVDTLMNLVGELVVAKNALPFLARDAETRFGSRELSREIKDKYAVIDRISRQLQNAVMDIRMMPVSDLFKRFPRLVRDIARKQDKKVRLLIEGESTEADKNIIEALAEPLTHVLRNSLDHGIEQAGVRTIAGKPEIATLKLRAFQDGDSVVIEVIDDGRGIDPDKVRSKAVERGLLDAERVTQLSDAQAVQLVFLPGFSTAEAVSDLSGRGVGMDAVRAVVERFGGHVTLESRSGEGTTVRLKLPLSMAVTRVLTVEMAGQLYGVPMDLVVETVRIEPGSIRRLKASEAVVLRDQVIPIARLRDMLGMERHRPALESVLILRVGNATVGMVIDDFGTGMDIILKPFSGILANLSGFSGTAVLGDGRVLLVLNLKEIL